MVATNQGQGAGRITSTILKELEDEETEIMDEIADLVVFSDGKVSYFEAWDMTLADRTAIVKSLTKQQKLIEQARKKNR